MPVSIVVGGQYGSEGKGKVAHYLAREMKASFAVRCGGPNSGHTVISKDGTPLIFQQLPTAAILPDVKLAICAGSYIDLDVLFKDINQASLDTGRLLIDPDAVIITNELKQREATGGLIKDIGSTGSGTGAAVAARVNREKSLTFAKDIDELKPFCSNISETLRSALNNDERVIVEGTQGFGLSPLHSKLYPFVTSRDTTAAAFLAETGLSPFDVDDITLTIRSFPIRVSGNSGKLEPETNWDAITKEGHHKDAIIEYSSVTKNIRRVGQFNSDIVKKAIIANRPNKIALNHIDYISNAPSEIITSEAIRFIKKVEHDICMKIDLYGLGRDIIFESKENFLRCGKCI